MQSRNLSAPAWLASAPDDPPTAGIPGCDMLVGLHSFPKTGNTWLRAIVAGIVGDPADRGQMAEYVIDTHMGQCIGHRPWRFAGRTWCFYKSHNMEPFVVEDGQVIRPDRILYIYRHPLDVFTSYLNYLSGNVTALSQKVFGFGFDRVDDLTADQMEHLFQRFLIHGTFDPRAGNPFGSLFDSIENYRTLQARGQPVHLLRYEDLSDDFDSTVQGISAFLDLPLDPGALDRIRATSERLTGTDGRFFWKRKVGTHCSYLSAAQIDRFWDRHHDRMQALGYAR
ncbi:sulfotransferase domain-containing protein [Seohaeicola saemankumensis]|uniref:Sulfotransferase domain-containing protein n=1 Tax=Seohaeicola saemankumensis TaxID=481181 RepID=A0ABW3TBX0_9RHOB